VLIPIDEAVANCVGTGHGVGSLRAQVTASSFDAILAMLAVFVPSISGIDAMHAQNEVNRYARSILDFADIRCSRTRLPRERHVREGHNMCRRRFRSEALMEEETRARYG
jgi:hypothetical protein